MSARSTLRAVFAKTGLLILILALATLGTPRAAAQTDDSGGGGSSEGSGGTVDSPIYNALPVTASLDFLTTPTLGGQGSVIWAGSSQIPIGTAGLTFTLESAGEGGDITAQTQTSTLLLDGSGLAQAQFNFTIPQAGSYRILAQVDWSDDQGTITNFYTLAFDVADGGAVSQVPDVIFTPIDSGTQYEVAVQDAAERLAAQRQITTASGPRVINPGTGATTWRLGGGYTIQWAGFSASQVRIDLVRAGKSVKTIAKSVGNTGNYFWTVPEGIKAAKDYKIAVSAAKGAKESAQSGGSFTISDVHVSAPNARNLAWIVGQPYTIAWAGLKASKVKIELFSLASLSRVIAASTANKGKFTWTIPADQAIGGDDWIKVTEVGVASPATAASESVFTIANPKIIMPDKIAAYWKPGVAYGIQWSGFVCSTVTIVLLEAGKVVQTISPAAPNTGQFTYTIPASQGLDWRYTVRITAQQNGTQVKESAQTFSIANPKLIYPSAAGITLHRGQKSTLTWSGFAGDKVRLEFYKGTLLADSVVAQNNGKYNISIPKKTTLGSDYWFRILSYNDLNQIAASASTFTIAE